MGALVLASSGSWRTCSISELVEGLSTYWHFDFTFALLHIYLCRVKLCFGMQMHTRGDSKLRVKIVKTTMCLDKCHRVREWKILIAEHQDNSTKQIVENEFLAWAPWWSQHFVFLYSFTMWKVILMIWQFWLYAMLFFCFFFPQITGCLKCFVAVLAFVYNVDYERLHRLTTEMPINVNSHCLSFWLSFSWDLFSIVLFSACLHHKPEFVNHVGVCARVGVHLFVCVDICL